jgi:hypothetical protein
MRQATNECRGRPAGGVGRERPEKGAALSDPAETLLEDAHHEPASLQVADSQRQQSSIGGDVRPQQRAGQASAESLAEQRLQRLRRRVHDRERSTGDRYRRGRRFKALRVGRDRQVADLTAGRDANPRKMAGQSLLQVARRR